MKKNKMKNKSKMRIKCWKVMMATLLLSGVCKGVCINVSPVMKKGKWMYSSSSSSVIVRGGGQDNN